MSMRTQARQMAHIQMEKAGRLGVNSDAKRSNHGRSYFSQNWRSFSVIPESVKKACAKDRAKQDTKRAARNIRRYA